MTPIVLLQCDRNTYYHFPVLHFPPLYFWSFIFQSCIFHACIFGPSFSSPAFSTTPVFLVLHFPLLHFQSTRELTEPGPMPLYPYLDNYSFRLHRLDLIYTAIK